MKETLLGKAELTVQMPSQHFDYFLLMETFESTMAEIEELPLVH